MFNDSSWLEHRHALQESRLDMFLNTVQRPLLLEVGAGDRIRTVRTWGERMARRLAGHLIRINPETPQANQSGPLHLPLRGLEALSAIEQQIRRLHGIA